MCKSTWKPKTKNNSQLSWLRAIMMLFCLWLMSLQQLHALALGPGLFLVQHVPPGQEINLRQFGGVLFTVDNDTDVDQDYNLTCRRPSESGLTEWELGYEEIPDAAWCRLEESVFSIPARGKKQVGLIIAIPDAAENYNRKMMLAVVLKSGKDPAFGVGLAIAARVQIETSVRDGLSDSGGGALAVAPGIIQVRGQPGEAFTGVVHVRNNTGQRLDARVERLPSVYTDPRKHGRYFSQGFQPRLDDMWFNPQKPTFALDDQRAVAVEFVGMISPAAALGQRYEELAFIRATRADGTSILTFIRVNYLVATADEVTPVPIPGVPGTIK